MSAQLRSAEALELAGMHLAPATPPPMDPPSIEVRQGRTTWRAEMQGPRDWDVTITTESEVGRPGFDGFTIAPGDMGPLRLLLDAIDREDARAQARMQDEADERETDK